MLGTRLLIIAGVAVALSACMHRPWGGMGPQMHGYRDMNSVEWTARMDAHMKAMQALHQAMGQARTPEERAALMESHRALMRDGGHMMDGMPCAPAAPATR